MRSPRNPICIALSLAALVPLWSGILESETAAADDVRGDGPLHYESHLLELPGDVLLTFYEDIDGDGLLDVLAVHEPPPGEEGRPPRDLVVFFQRPSGFLSDPDLLYRVADDVAVIDLGNVSDFPGQELVLLTGREIRWRSLPRPGSTEPVGQRLEGDGETLVKTRSLFASSEPDHLRKRDIAQTLDDSERAVLFVPRTEGYSLYYPDESYQQAHDIAAEHFHMVSQDQYSVRPAKTHLADVDGDGRDDLAFSHLDRLQVHYQENGHFHTAPDLELDLQIVTEVDRESWEYLPTLVGFEIADFDGDDLADLFVYKTVVQKKAVINDKKQYQLYRNRGGRFEIIPDQAFVLKSLDEPDILDFDGDGKLDLITGYFEFSVGNIIKALLAKRLTFQLSFFLYEANGFPDQPNESRDVSIRISLTNMDENFAPAVEVEGDYDGDGRLDFLLQSADEKVEIFLGLAEERRLFEKKASVTLETFACNGDHVADLNGDGRTDMVFAQFPDREPFDPRWINVLLSR
jgi:hypothetical protein